MRRRHVVRTRWWVSHMWMMTRRCMHRRRTVWIMSLLLRMVLLLLLQLLKLELLPLQLLKLLINVLILLRQIPRIHSRHGSWHHWLHARHSESHGHSKGHGGHRSRHELLLGVLKFGGTMTAHTKAKTGIITQE
mmetsp:Transcript_106636/g.306783  ORF Transcript_106636/g.306783 Transcript_106636/m.306783 type:complete len:134 (-) Transcript_106636:506-907(-)